MWPLENYIKINFLKLAFTWKPDNRAIWDSLPVQQEASSNHFGTDGLKDKNGPKGPIVGPLDP